MSRLIINSKTQKLDGNDAQFYVKFSKMYNSGKTMRLNSFCLGPNLISNFGAADQDFSYVIGGVTKSIKIS